MFSKIEGVMAPMVPRPTRDPRNCLSSIIHSSISCSLAITLVLCSLFSQTHISFLKQLMFRQSQSGLYHNSDHALTLLDNLADNVFTAHFCSIYTNYLYGAYRVYNKPDSKCQRYFYLHHCNLKLNHELQEHLGLVVLLAY